MMDDIIVKYEHARRLHFCAKGMRLFCKFNNINYLKFIKQGISAKQLSSYDDYYANQMINLAKKDQGD